MLEAIYKKAVRTHSLWYLKRRRGAFQQYLEHLGLLPDPTESRK